MTRTFALILALVVVTTACGDGGEPSTTAAAGPVFVNRVEFVFLESFPVQVRAIIFGDLPTPCHELVVDYDGADAVRLWSLSSPDPCDLVLQPFETTVDLGPRPDGEYVLIVNAMDYPYVVGG